MKSNDVAVERNLTLQLACGGWHVLRNDDIIEKSYCAACGQKLRGDVKDNFVWWHHELKPATAAQKSQQLLARIALIRALYGTCPVPTAMTMLPEVLHGPRRLYLCKLTVCHQQALKASAEYFFEPDVRTCTQVRRSVLTVVCHMVGESLGNHEVCE